MRENQADVLVVGAGPTGLFTALLLAERGIPVQVVDREERTTSRSYACALHPRTLNLLNEAGLASDAVRSGHKVQKVAFYDGDSREAEIDLAKLGGDFPFLLILPQAALEGLLEQRLRGKGVNVRWGHRFDDVLETKEGITATIEKLGGTSTGYIVPHWETVVQKRFEIQARFLVGTDGHNSLVRRRLGLDLTRVSGPEFFAAYEFESDAPCEDEVRVVLDAGTTNVLWPLNGTKGRWTFQLKNSDISSEFPDKERSSVRLEESAVDEHVKQYVQKVAAHRAPWFKAAVKNITWCTEVVFEHSLAASFGRGRCWLAGDAAHQTGPVGAQSMNVGLFEARSLAQSLENVLRGTAGMDSLEAYSATCHGWWESLLGLGGKGLKPNGHTSAWVHERMGRLLSCLPSSDADLSKLANQLNLRF